MNLRGLDAGRYYYVKYIRVLLFAIFCISQSSAEMVQWWIWWWW